MKSKSLKYALKQLNIQKSTSNQTEEEMDFLTSKEGNEIKGGKGISASTSTSGSSSTITITKPVDGCKGFECPTKFTCDWFLNFVSASLKTNEAETFQDSKN